MKAAPLAVFAAIASTVTTQGLGVLVTYGKFIIQFYVSLGILWLLLGLAGFLALGPRVQNLVRRMREPFLLAFSTASSEAAYPKILDQLQQFGVSKRIASFVLPMGYSFNLDGSMMYCTFATLFIAQAYGIELSFAQQITMLLLLMVTSKGMAGVPRASLDCGDADDLQHSRGWSAADHGHRPISRYGPQRDQRGRQLHRHRRGGQMGGRAWRRA
jgi:Na+/H+-dicarboxylate symporter